MSVYDFIEQFAYLYICRLLGEGWYEKRIDSEWKGKSAAGLPTRNNPKARIDFNP